MYFLRAAAIAGICLFSNAARAQIVGNNAFLRGQYLEVGIGGLGYFGSDSAAPAGFHPHCSACINHNAVGFVADPGMTSWDTSSTSHYMGDYFLPGSPFEGWELQVDGKRCQGYHKMWSSYGFGVSGGMGACTGSVLSYAASGSTVSATWQGSADSITITQVTSLDTTALYFKVQVTLTNMAVAPKNNIYYFRSLDPDNDQSWPGGSFPTHNMVEHQMPDTFNVSLVSATGMSSSSAYMALGSVDTASRVMIYNCWYLDSNQDLADVYNQVYGSGGCGAFYDEGVDHFGDIGIGLTINVPHLATLDSAGDSVYRTTAGTTLHPANTATFTYFYAFGHAAVDSAIRHTGVTTSGGGTVTLGINNVNNAADIKVYPNPSKDIFYVSGLSLSDHLSLYDMMGRNCCNLIVKTEGTNTFSYNDLPTGAYILIVSDAGGNVKTRVPVRKQ